MPCSLVNVEVQNGHKCRLRHATAILVGMIWFLAGGVPPTRGQGSELAKLAGIHVTGSQRFSEKEIIRVTGLAIGMNLWAQTLQEATNRLLATGAFAEVKFRYYIRGSAMTAEFQVTDAEKFVPCSFENFVWFSDDELDQMLRARVPLFAGQVPLTGDLAEKAARSLEDLLASRKIAGRVQSMPYVKLGGSVAVMQFRVEGAALPIARVQYEGIRQVNPALVNEATKFLIGKEYERTLVQDFAQKSVSAVYLKRGFLRVDFAAPHAQPPAGGMGAGPVTVTVPVDEGPRYQLAEVRWAGNTAFPATDLAKLLHLRAGEPVDAVQLEEDLESAKDLYATRGYLLAQVEPRPTLNEAARTASYDLTVREGDLYRMGDLAIMGVDAPTAVAFEARSTLRPGMPFNKSYWNTFIRESLEYLAQRASGWKTEFQMSVREANKTVNVTIRFRAPGR
jgi:outer membrane protein assembly factor BamA